MFEPLAGSSCGRPLVATVLEAKTFGQNLLFFLLFRQPRRNWFLFLAGLTFVFWKKVSFEDDHVIAQFDRALASVFLLFSSDATPKSPFYANAFGGKQQLRCINGFGRQIPVPVLINLPAWTLNIQNILMNCNVRNVLFCAECISVRCICTCMIRILWSGASIACRAPAHCSPIKADNVNHKNAFSRSHRPN